MPLFEASNEGLRQVPNASFVAEGLGERSDLQQWLRRNPDALGGGLYIVTEEFSPWKDARRRIDLLALDDEGNLVVIELKRTDDGGHMDLQAVRYAAMISDMRLGDVVDAHEAYLAKYEPAAVGQARDRLLQHLSDVPEPVEVGTIPRIVLVSQGFDKEVTTTVLWLTERGLDIRCFQAQPYRVADRLLIEFRQVIPLAVAEDYRVKLRQKEEEVRQATTRTRREASIKILVRHGLVKEGTELVVVPKYRTEPAAGNNPALYIAHAADTSGRGNWVTWEFDGQRYSLKAINAILYERGALKSRGGNRNLYWCRAGEARSLAEEAEGLADD